MESIESIAGVIFREVPFESSDPNDMMRYFVERNTVAHLHLMRVLQASPKVQKQMEEDECGETYWRSSIAFWKRHIEELLG